MNNRKSYDVEVSNKRELFRLRLQIPFSFSILDSTNPKVARNQVYTYHSHDISASGLGFETHLPLRKGDKLSLSLLLPSTESVKVDAEVMWSQQHEEVWVGGLTFSGIDNDEQDRIVAYMFRAQIEARKKLVEPKEESEGEN